jgi:hypothetical protein
MRELLQRLFGHPPARQARALQKRRIEEILRGAGLSKAAAERACWRLMQELEKDHGPARR